MHETVNQTFSASLQGDTFSGSFCVTRQCANYLITNAFYELLVSFGNRYLCKSWASAVFNPMWCENKEWWIKHGIIRRFKSDINQLWTSGAIWRNPFGSTLAQIIIIMPESIGPLPEIVFTFLWWEQFHNEYPSYYPMWCIWNLRFQNHCHISHGPLIYMYGFIDLIFKTEGQ